MRAFTKFFLVLTGAFISTAILIFAVGYTAPRMSAAAASYQAAIAAAPAAPVVPVAQQAQNGTSITVTLNAHDVSGLKDLFIWVRANFTNTEIRQAMLDAYMFICAERPGVPPGKPGPQVTSTPPPPPCPACSGGPGGDAP